MISLMCAVRRLHKQNTLKLDILLFYRLSEQSNILYSVLYCSNSFHDDH